MTLLGREWWKANNELKDVKKDIEDLEKNPSAKDLLRLKGLRARRELLLDEVAGVDTSKVVNRSKQATAAAVVSPAPDEPGPSLRTKEECAAFLKNL